MTTEIILEYASPICGFAGTILIFLYGIPRQIDTNGYKYYVTRETDPIEIRKIKKYKRRGYLGLVFIALSFILSLGAIYSEHSSHNGTNYTIEKKYIY